MAFSSGGRSSGGKASKAFAAMKFFTSTAFACSKPSRSAEVRFFMLISTARLFKAPTK